MYVKIVTSLKGRGVSSKSGSAEELVVPYKTHLIECEDVSWRKYISSWTDAMGHFPDGEIIVDYDSSGTDESLNREFCEICIAKPTRENDTDVRYKWVTVIGGDIFIMNKDGKTIDGIHCVSPEMLIPKKVKK